MSGFNCSNCGYHVKPGEKHVPYRNTAHCETYRDDGTMDVHYWECKPGGETHKAHGSHLSQTAVNNHRVDGWRVLQRAATDLIGEPVTLESMKRVDSHDYVTVELIVRKD